MDYFKESLKLHKEKKGKIEIKSKVPLKTKDDLSLAYTPGVAASCSEIAKNPDTIYDYTSKGNFVAIVTDGSAVLGLGNIGPRAALPVMEGKAIIFKEFGDVDAFPIIIDSQDTEEIIKTVKNISLGFGGINLEDISAPRCFEIEERLKAELDIPVFHDDQHGTSMVVLAALINAAKVAKKEFSGLKVLINGAGAAGISTAKLLLKAGIKDIVMVDSKGAISYCREDIKNNKSKVEIAILTNARCKYKTGESQSKDKKECENCITGSLSEAIIKRDVFIGVSVAGVLKPEMVKSMAKDPIIFALANPIPEIMPDIAKEAGALVIGTGRSDFPNQINNSLGFPNIFRGAFDAKAKDINTEMVIAGAYALSKFVKNPTAEMVIPGPFDKGFGEKIAKAVYDAAIKSGVARI
jgi:malate dehydrogenase (oxaloacetate-decarboxylating)